MQKIRILLIMTVLMIALVLQAIPTQAFSVGGWSKIYEGIEYNTGYEPSNPRMMRAFALRISLRNPDVAMYASHGNGTAPYEVALQTTPAFLSDHGLKAAVNSCYFNAGLSPNTDIEGLLVSNGSVVSTWQAARDAEVRFTADKAASIMNNGGTGGVYNGCAGDAWFLVNGVAGGDPNAPPEPRTTAGLSQDGKYLILVCVDGRQSGWSLGATLYDMSIWQLNFGAYNAMNLDGGGSTTLVRADAGVCNRPCYGYNRSVGASLGVSSVNSNTQGPSGCAMNANRYDIVYRGNMNNIVWRTWTNTGGWGAPVNLGGTTYDEPAISTKADNSFEVFHRGTNNHLYVGSYLNGVWYTWTDLGGTITSGPCAVCRDSNHIDVYARGASNQLVTIGWYNGTWYGWQSLDGTLTSSPSAISRDSSHIDVYARGASNQLITKGWLNGTWYGWQDLGGALTSSPTACNRDANHIEVFSTSTDGHMYVRSWLSGTWYGWEDLGAQPATRPAAFCPTSTSIVTVHRGSNDHQFQHTWSGSWGGYVDIGCPF